MLKIKDLTITAKVSNKTVTIADKFSFDLKFGESVAVIGESGSGKSMIAMSIMGLLPDNVNTTGSIMLGDTNLSNANNKLLNTIRGKRIVLIPQGGHDFLNPSLRVGTQILECVRLQGVDRGQSYDRAIAALKSVGFDDPERIYKSYPHQLSGGMAQKVMLAISIITNPELVICDEPTRGVDADAARSLILLIKELMPKASLLLITHDLSLIDLCKTTIVLLDGKIMEIFESVSLSKCVSPYTKALISALPKNGLNPITKINEKTANGCKFSPYCKKALDTCFLKEAELKNTEIGQVRCQC